LSPQLHYFSHVLRQSTNSSWFSYLPRP